MRKLLCLILVFVIGLSVAGCSGDSSSTSEHVFAKISIRDYGDITVELYPEKAPITVDNFVKLANQHFYDGLLIHRVYPGFVIQGGNAALMGRNGSNTIKGEFSLNGVNNDLSHTRGAISMARPAALNDGASSQFFICVADRPDLNGNYACFGYVTEGIEIVDQICANVTNIDYNGNVQDFSQMPIIESVVIIDNREG